MHVLGLDVGGANLKAATNQDAAWSQPFALWRHPEQLPAQIAALVDRWPHAEAIGVTLTGELADCFRTKSDGVTAIVQAVVQAANGRAVAVWSTDGEFISAERAIAEPRRVAAANWHALATWVGRMWPAELCLLIDIGSTTTDIIPQQAGRPVAQGRDDLGRLQAGELVYTGVRRTPVCALAQTVPIRGHLTPLAAELFATSHDLYLWTGDIAENPADCDTANGRPATRLEAEQRLARMVCCDTSELADSHLEELVESLCSAQVAQVLTGLRQVLAQHSPPELIVLSGEGEFLARRVLGSLPETSDLPVISLTDELSADVATAACAHAVAQLLHTSLT